jgi:hypothetical protein
MTTEKTSRGSNKVRDTNTGSAAPGPILASPLLEMKAKALDEIEDMRKANENRLRQLQDPDTFALPADNPEVVEYRQMVESIKAVEDSTIKQLEKIMRNHPLGKLQATLIGVGEKQLARTLAAVRDPYWNDPADAPRTFGQLKAYCGLDVRNGEAPELRRGLQCNWNGDARMRLWNVAGKTIMFDGAADKNGKQRARSPYRDVYDEAKIKYADAVHATACKRCGPKGKPAQPGSALSDGHKHGRAIRLVMVAILRDLYIEAARLHGVVVDQTSTTPIPDTKPKVRSGVVDQVSRSSKTLAKTNGAADDRDQTSSAPIAAPSPKVDAARKTKPSTRKSVRKVPRAAG